MRRNAIRTSVMLVAILLLPLLVLVAQETSALLIEGPQGQTRVIHVQGKNYVEVDEIARRAELSDYRQALEDARSLRESTARH